MPAAWVIMFGMVFIPPLYSWYNIVGFWDPYGNTNGITVAVANNDTGIDNAIDSANEKSFGGQSQSTKLKRQTTSSAGPSLPRPKQ